MHQILIYEDNERLRNSLELLLKGMPNMNVVGGFGNCDKVIEQVKNLSPTVILMDIDMPGEGGIIGVEKVKRHFPEVFVLMFTVFDDDERLMACLRSGANGYLLKKTSPLQIIDAIENVASGGAPMTPEIARRVLETFKVERKIPSDLGLTPREMQVLELLIKGHTYKMIAHDFSISVETVRSHLKNIYEKMHVNNGNEAVAKALRMRLFE
ncbi:response regulator transcription factor [Arcicella rosea]|uniref:DNA-binding NarL/FixJ family response regulator n=1 Tax=Arcicella rosea TaxID=502909 RepID=A0A841EQ84_9BACT|nr:response regulator transcription factor [Arcicella rosea]MBB6002868.1 DNA-binding NarL/FixJ family response regulator [Arcicella rosea]